jgi:hypothetical protein
MVAGSWKHKRSINGCNVPIPCPLEVSINDCSIVAVTIGAIVTGMMRMAKMECTTNRQSMIARYRASGKMTFQKGRDVFGNGGYFMVITINTSLINAAELVVLFCTSSATVERLFSQFQIQVHC